jgi:hypothetical protein
MRVLLICLAALASACAQRPERCDFTVSREIAFTGAEASDRIVVRSFGASCDKAIGVYEIVDADERPIYAWAQTLPRAFGDTISVGDAEAFQAFLERWATPEITATQAAPEWTALSAGQTTLDQLTYSDIRARDLPMLCHFSGTARQACVFWEPAAGGAGHLFDRDTEESE